MFTTLLHTTKPYSMLQNFTAHHTPLQLYNAPQNCMTTQLYNIPHTSLQHTTELYSTLQNCNFTTYKLLQQTLQLSSYLYCTTLQHTNFYTTKLYDTLQKCTMLQHTTNHKFTQYNKTLQLFNILHDVITFQHTTKLYFNNYFSKFSAINREQIERNKNDNNLTLLTFYINKTLLFSQVQLHLYLA